MKSKYVIIWEQFMNTQVPKDCCIHHLDQNKNNNDILNLVCVTKSEHMRWHASHRSKESLEKMKNAKLGIHQSEETIRKRSDSLKKYVKTEEHRRKISETMKGRKRS